MHCNEHVLAAISVVEQCLQELEETLYNSKRTVVVLEPPPLVYFGIASSLAHCGLIGPLGYKTFTAVSPGETQCGALVRMGASLHVPVVLTWRAVEFAHQEKKIVTKRDPRIVRAAATKFAPVALVNLPGETNAPATVMFTIVK